MLGGKWLGGGKEARREGFMSLRRAVIELVLIGAATGCDCSVGAGQLS